MHGYSTILYERWGFVLISVGICSDSSIQLTRTLISHRWQLNNGVKATPKALKAALCEMRLMSIVDKYFEGV